MTSQTITNAGSNSQAKWRPAPLKTGFLWSLLATAVMPSVAVGVTIVGVALLTAKVNRNPPERLWQLLQTAFWLAVAVPNGFIVIIGLKALQPDRVSSQQRFVAGVFIGVLAGLPMTVVAAFIMFLFVMTFFYGAGL